MGGRVEVLEDQYRRSYPKTRATPRLYEGMAKVLVAGL